MNVKSKPRFVVHALWMATAIGMALGICPAASAALVTAQLRCELGVDPMGIDVTAPQLSWIVASPDRGEKQTAYQVLAASSLAMLNAEKGDLWDSGKVVSDATSQLLYKGRALESGQQAFWQVRSWNKDGRSGAWSAPAAWTMGVLNDADWHARWIGADPAVKIPEGGTLLLRREFTVRPGLRRAVANVCGLGQYEMSFNGAKAGQDLLAPGWTNYKKTCLYDTHDVTALLHTGSNAAGLFLGNGMYNVVEGNKRYAKFKGSFGPLKAICQIRLEYEDGSVEWVGTDDQWHNAPGPVTFSSIFGGEDYDARLEQRGWDQPGFDEAKWALASIMEGPGGALRGFSCAAPPIRAFDVLKPVSVNPLRPGLAVYDLGQNASLIPRIAVKGTAGATVKIIPAELIKPDGSVDRSSCGGGATGVYCQYTLAGSGESERWFPKFFYHGSRYLQVECSAPTQGGELPSVESLEGVVVHSAAEPVGEFSCSNDLFNRIHTLVRWAQRSNMMSVLTDCPHRERLGWLEQTHLNGPALRYEFDLGRLFSKTMNDMADAQRPDGLIPDIAPEYAVFKGGFLDSPEWGSAFLLVPWQQYEFNGELELLRRHYNGMKRYVDYLSRRATEGIVSHGLGDWYDIGPKRPGVSQLTPIPLTATAFYYADADIIAKTARLLGKTDDAATYGQLASDIKLAFNKKFWNEEKGSYGTGSQTANALALVMGFVEPAKRQRVENAIVFDVWTNGHNRSTAGDVGYRYVLRALADGNRSDVIHGMNNNSVSSGYGYQIAQGATSLTEAWDAGRSSSQNHFMLGQIMEWFYHDLGGIAPDPEGPGFKKILIKPEPVGDVTRATVSYASIHGRVVSEWEREGEHFKLHVVIPANTAATVRLPTRHSETVREGGQTVGTAPGVRLLSAQELYADYAVESGAYDFTAEL